MAKWKNRNTKDRSFDDKSGIMKKQVFILSQIVILISALLFIISPRTLSAQNISAHNTSKYVCNGKWKWTIFIQAFPQVLDGIRSVEYTLHPTFPNPVRMVNSIGDSRFPFGLTTIGWGTFEISIKVIFENGEVRHLKHMLTFEAPPVEDPLPIETRNVAISVGKNRWKWTVFIQGSSNVLDQIRCVEYTLHPTFPKPVQEVSKRGTGSRAFALSAIGWGTFQIRLRVFLRNGQVQELTHDLRF